MLEKRIDNQEFERMDFTNIGFTKAEYDSCSFKNCNFSKEDFVKETGLSEKDLNELKEAFVEKYGSLKEVVQNLDKELLILKNKNKWQVKNLLNL